MRANYGIVTKKMRYRYMNKVKVLMVFLLVAICAQGLFAAPRRSAAVGKGVSATRGEHFELGLQVGIGLHCGMTEPAEGVTRVYQNAVTTLADKFPVMETFGAVARYSLDYHWAFQAQAMRQRIYFKDGGSHFYNAMWDVDVTAEYNILNYGTRFHRPKSSRWLRSRAYPITPYVFFGVGVAISNKYAPVRGKGAPVHEWTPEDLDKMYTMIGPSNLAANFYLPVGVGVKWRMAYNWQLKAACQYNLGIGKEPSGGTVATKAGDEIRTSYDDLRIGVWNNVVLNLGVIYSFGERKRMLVNY